MNQTLLRNFFGLVVLSALLFVGFLTKQLTPEQEADVDKLLEKIEEDEDVQNVYHTMA